RLPTEAEWEYACRAESTTPFGFGDGTKALQQHAWVLDNSEGETHPVGHMRPNAWGLFDLHGNVAEWCGDRYGEKYYADSPKADPKGPADGQGRVCRGGAWSGDWQAIRSAARTGSGIDEKSSAVGFRVVVEAE
ncbi:MAG TPA: SUMF1/EgtB/PvdO family nonheme iron enzyme, partial [Phycisphaerae bacterium]|nr:SUMF1/EgtB/PvdO family nonheme iron enzyme [Phycisphaerae bacterium]